MTIEYIHPSNPIQNRDQVLLRYEFRSDCKVCVMDRSDAIKDTSIRRSIERIKTRIKTVTKNGSPTDEDISFIRTEFQNMKNAFERLRRTTHLYALDIIESLAKIYESINDDKEQCNVMVPF